jgi:hypothetical protein
MEKAMLPARTYSVSIKRDSRALYEHIWRPEFFPRWASGLSDSELRQDNGSWVAEGAEGPIRIRFTPHNDHGVMDHFVDMGEDQTVHIPLRVVQNGDGAEVMLTLYRQPGMDDERFSADAKWVMKDLRTLKTLVEQER